MCVMSTGPSANIATLLYLDCDTVHYSYIITRYSLKFSTNNFVSILYFNISFISYT
jgi:hypothetical protein